MMRKQPLLGALVMAAVAVGVAACGGQKATGPDAGNGDETGGVTQDGGVDAGAQDPGDAGGTGDAGSEDAGTTDAGHDVDAGHDHDAGMDSDAGMGEADAGCGTEHPVFFAIKQQDWGWPLNTGPSGLPACATGNNQVDCDNVLVRRFTDDVSLAAFYQDELQMTPPVINFNIADAVVTYSCSCPTMGHQMITHDVVADDCELNTVTELEKPGETCFTQQTFTRPFSTVEITRSSAPNVRTKNSVTIYSCQ